MKKLTVFLTVAFLLMFFSQSWGERRTRGYLKKDGAYVQPHSSTSPNKTRSDNWTTRENVNPYTGKRGYRNPYKSSPNQFTPNQPRSRPLRKY